MAAPFHPGENEALLEGGAPASGGARRRVRGMAAAGALLGLAAAGTAAGFSGAFGAQRPSVATSSAAVGGIVAEWEIMGIFGDLAAHLEIPRGVDAESLSKEVVEGIFDRVMHRTGASDNLTESEAAAYKSRFVDAVLQDTNSSAIEAAKTAITAEKPLMPEKMAKAINEQGLGYTVKPVATTVAVAQKSLGLRVPSNLKLEQPARSSATFPSSFDTREKWPECAGIIGRVYNQGLCGSCWAFSGLQALDSALCIAESRFRTNNSSLSRGFATSCVYASQGRDGCQGGWPTDVWKYVQDTGSMPSTTCVSYFAEGAGSEHPQETVEAPPCPSQCDDGSGVTWGASQYRPLNVGMPAKQVGGWYTEHMMEMMSMHGPVSMAMPATYLPAYTGGIFKAGCNTQVNHAVTAIGYTPQYVVVMNSWGEDWGLNGTFKGDWCVVEFFMVPGPIEPEASGYEFATV